MSEAAAPEAPKKKGKLPIILALALVLGGGGFFMMKGKGAKKKDAPAPTLVLAEKETELEEFLTNTGNPGVYVRAKLTVKLTKEFTEDKFKNSMGDVRDAVLGVLNATPPSEITDASKRAELKKKLAEAMNTALAGPLEDGKKGDGEQKDDTPRRKGKQTERPTEAASDDWDSKTGPVLQVRFAALATQ